MVLGPASTAEDSPRSVWWYFKSLHDSRISRNIDASASKSQEDFLFHPVRAHKSCFAATNIKNQTQRNQFASFAELTLLAP